MTKYIFSKGTIQIAEGVELKPEKQHHPLQSAPLFIVNAYAKDVIQKHDSKSKR